MSPAEKEVIARLLELASEVFSSHRCNDFVMPNDEAHRAIEAGYMEWNKDTSEEATLESAWEIWHSDFALMDYFAAKLRGET